MNAEYVWNRIVVYDYAAVSIGYNRGQASFLKWVVSTIDAIPKKRRRDGVAVRKWIFQCKYGMHIVYSPQRVLMAD